MTIVLTVFGLLVFLISLITAGFKTAFKRLMMFIATGVVIDLTMLALAGTVVYTLIH